MITVENIERRLRKIDYTKPSPSREMLEALMADGRSRILKASETDKLCADSERYFEFCLSQVGSFCAASYNAVEIALMINIQPIYIAAAINLYGCDWGHRFLGLKRFAALDRGINTVWKSADAWFALGECQNRTKNIFGDASKGQTTLRRAIQSGDMDIIRQVAHEFPHRAMSILQPRKEMLYTDPRAEKSKKEREAAKAAAQAAGKKLAERGAFNDMGSVFNGAITPRNTDRGFSDSSETRSAVNGRRFRV